MPRLRSSAIFLSTLPARGATIDAVLLGDPLDISIHAPREGSDVLDLISLAANNTISIHAPREGSDVLLGRAGRTGPDFYPRSPRGERPGITWGRFRAL